MKNVIIILTLLLLYPAMPVLPAESKKPAAWTVDDVLLRLKERERTLTTFVAEFKQVQQNNLFDQAQTSEGTLFFHHDGRLLMKMITPEAYLVLITGRDMIMEIPGTSSYRHKKLPGGNTFFRQIMGIGQSIGQLKNKYAIHMEESPRKDSCEMELRPLKKGRRIPFSSIRVTINTLQWLPESIRLEEPDGDMTLFQLQFRSINHALPDHIFDIPALEKRIPSPENSHDIK